MPTPAPTLRRGLRVPITRSLPIALLVALVLALGASSVLAQAPAPVRVQGDTPTAYGVALSQAVFDDAGGAGTVALHAVIARDDDFADSLAAGPLLNGGPMLYVPGGDAGTLPDEVAAELQRILPPASIVYVAGGTAAVSQGIEDAIDALGFIVIRLAGEERTATAVAIAERVEQDGNPSDTVLVALAGNWPDAVAGGSLAASEGYPLVLTDGTTASAATADYLADRDVEVVILGGTAAISEEVATALDADRRIEGATRAHTAAAMVTEFGEDVTGTSLVQGYVDDGWVQGNAGAVLLQPLLLNGPDVDALNPPAIQALDGRDGELFILGGTDLIGEAAATAADEARG